MSYAHPYWEEYAAEQRRKEAVHQAAMARLCREAGIDTRGWAARQVCAALCGLGRVMIAVGHRLERFDLPATTTSTRQQQAV